MSLLFGVVAPLMFYFVYVVALRRIFKLGGPERERAIRSFLERTGYRVQDHEGLSLAAQAAVVTREAYASLPPVARPYVRDLDGGRLTYFHPEVSGGASWGAPFGQSGWALQLAEPLRVRWSVVRAGSEAWRPPLPRVDVEALGLEDVEAHAADAVALEGILAAPGLVEALARCADLELHVLGDVVLFVDRKLQNLLSESGGAVAGMAVATDPMRQMDLVAMAHGRVADLLVDVVDATRRVA